MKKGYIVWNQTTWGDGYEFFGVFRSENEAKKCLRRVLKKRFGKVPSNWEELNEMQGSEDCYGISYFDSEEA